MSIEQHHRLRRRFYLKITILFFSTFAIVTGCKDNVTSLGAAYYKDTIANQTTIRKDTGFLHFADTQRTQVVFVGVNVGLTDSTTTMIVGRYSNGNENVDSWGVMQFLPIANDTISMIQSAKLVLKSQLFSYGDTTNTHVAFDVYSCYGQIYNYDSSTQQFTNLLPVGSIDTVLADSLDAALTIALDTSILKQPNGILTESNNGFIIIPKSSMTNARAFGTMHSYGDANSIPHLELFLNSSGTTVQVNHNPTLDFHVVHDSSTTPPGEFTLRGGAGKRERINLNLTSITDTAAFNTFSTINDATLILHVDWNNSRLANINVSNLIYYGPAIFQLGSVDSANHFDGDGAYDSINGVYRFQLRGLVEGWLRNPSQNLGFELRAGNYGHTNFGSPSSPQSIGVEDNTLNRWTFFGPDCADTSKRPYFILSYSRLK